MALITAVEVRAQYIIGLSGTNEDTKITEYIDVAGELMARWCFFPPASPGGTPTMESTTYTEFFDGPMVDVPSALKLSVSPVLSITTAEIDGLGDWSYDTAIDAADRTLDGEKARLYLNPNTSESWRRGLRSNKVVYVAGFSSVTSVAKAAAGTQVALWWALRRTRGKSSVSGRGSNINVRKEGLSDEVQQMLSSFRLIANSVG